jgi:hypothetical protein
MVVNPGAPFEVVFVGEVPEGNLSNPLPAGMSLISSKAPVQGLLDFPAIDGDMIQTWDPVAQAYRSHFYGSGVWDDPPVPVPGESFWLTTVANRTWTQDFGAPRSSANCPPVIEQQPLDQAADAGETVDFTVLASGSAPLSYQWRKGGVNLTNGTSISGATSAHLVITNVQLADAGDYTAVVTNAYGSVISSVAVLTVLAAPSHPVAEVYFTNAVVLANGYAQFEVQAPSADTSLVLLYSFDLKDWGYWTALSGSTNYVLQVPEPIANFSQVFCRAAPLGQAFHEFSFEFRTLWNGPLVNGTPALAWPQPLDNWQAILDVRNSTNFPPQGSVFFNGPAGSGIVDLPTEFWPDEAYTGSYESGLYPVPPTPPGAAWTVAYGTGQLTFNQPDPQTGGRYVLMVPQFAISNNLLTSVSWSYRNPDTGAVLASIPDFIESMEFSIYGPDYTQCGADDGTVFESPSNLGRQMTNWVLDVPMLWSNAMVQFKYEDTLKNTYRAYYTFGTVYEVFGANSYGALDYCDPAASGFTLLGSATSTATIAGAYNYYLVRVPKHNVVKVDTVQGSNQSYYPTYVTGNTSDYQNIGGAPDGLYATVGPTGRGFYTGGMFLIDAAGHGLTSLTVITVP